MIDQHPEEQTAAERERIEKVEHAQRSITYWFTVFAIVIVWDLLTDDMAWWWSIVVGVGSTFAAGRVAFGKGFLTGKKG